MSCCISPLINHQPETDSLTFYYHPDHLGSTTYITDREGNPEQYLSYLPYGEVFIDKSFKDSYATPYKFNGKELDEETGLYYYGARYLHPKYGMWLSVDRFAETYPYSSPYMYCLGNPLKFSDINGDTLIVMNSQGSYLFTLDDYQSTHSKITAKNLYNRGIQWFESSADKYMPLLFVNANIKESNSYKHFTWEDIIAFAEVDRSMISYRSGGSGDWKARGKPGDGYLMVEVEGIPYWTDAIGQIPFALNEYRNVFNRSKNSEIAAGETIEAGKAFGNGSLINIILPSPDNSNRYDNAMIRRAVKWAKNRYRLQPVLQANGEFEMMATKTGFSPTNMQVYTKKRRNI